jgi:CRISPR-associated endonuclease Cas1
MAATQTVPQHLKDCNFTPIAPQHGVITLFGYGSRLSVERGHLIVEDRIGPRRRYGRFARVRHGIKRVVAIGSDGSVSLAALRWLADQDAAFVMLERDGKVLATTGPVKPSDARLRRSQSLAQESGIALKIARELISEKLLAQERIIKTYFRESSCLPDIAAARKLVGTSKSNEEIRRWEAKGAKAYWSAMREVPVNFNKSDSSKIPEHWRRFGSRISPLTNSPRLAVNPANAILNYLYAVLESESRLALATLGLDPGIGVLHSDLRSRDSLACDLMEPVRPKVDSLVLDLLFKEQLRREWFFEQRDGNCRLMASFAEKLSETTIMWRTAVASFAEWIVKCFWDSGIRPVRREAPATRLTQRQRSEGRAKLLSDQEANPLRPVLCRTCGHICMSRDGVCRDCATASQSRYKPV